MWAALIAAPELKATPEPRHKAIGRIQLRQSSRTGTGESRDSETNSS